MTSSIRQLSLTVFATSILLAPAACAQEAGSSAEEINIAGLLRKDGKPLERIDGVGSHYGMVETVDGARLRTIITIPADATAPPHPILFTQWVSCGTIEFRPGRSGGILARLAQKSGLALVRVERSSDGDSQGPACDELDYDTEIAHYTEAFDALLKDENLNAEKIYVYGSSLGSTTAPLVAHALQEKGYDIAGIAVQGGGAETYYERMLTFDRQYLERRPDEVNPADIHDELIARAKFQYEYLIKDRDPDDIAGDSAEMAAVRADVRGLGDVNQYGRPYAWHQQAAKQNFLAAWAALDAPVLVIFNEFDQFEARYGHKLITDTVERLRPGTATYVEQKNTGHSSARFDTIEDAYADLDGVGVPVWEGTADVILGWLEEVQASND